MGLTSPRFFPYNLRLVCPCILVTFDLLHDSVQYLVYAPNPELLPTPLPIKITGEKGKDIDPYDFEKCSKKCLDIINDPDPEVFTGCVIDCRDTHLMKKCIKGCNENYPNDSNGLLNCMAGCKSGAFSKQANGFIITAMLFMFYLINSGAK